MLASGGSLENKIKPMPKYVYGFWLVCWVMFGLSFFTSKSGLSIFSSLLIIISVFYVDWKAFLKEKWLVLFVMTLPLGMFLNLFSLGGWESSLKFLLANPWPLMIIPGFHLIKQGNGLKLFLGALALSLVAAMVKSASIFYDSYGLVFTSQTRVHSFFDIGRWGQFIGTAAVALLPFCYRNESHSKSRTWALRGLFLSSVLSLLLSNTRGPWLGFFIASTLVIILMRKKVLLIGSIYLAALISGVVLSNGLKNRISSIVQVQEGVDGVISSSDASNAGRLHMWSVALDFYKEQPWFGVGMKSMEKPMRDFLDRKGASYRQMHSVPHFSYNDTHSSYLRSLVEMGVIFFVYIWSIYFGLMIFLFKKIVTDGKKTLIAPLAILIFSSVVFVFYSSYATYECLISFVVVPLWVRCILINKNSETSNINAVKNGH